MRRGAYGNQLLRSTRPAQRVGAINLPYSIMCGSVLRKYAAKVVHELRISRGELDYPANFCQNDHCCRAVLPGSIRVRKTATDRYCQESIRQGKD